MRKLQYTRCLKMMICSIVIGCSATEPPANSEQETDQKTKVSTDSLVKNDKEKSDSMMKALQEKLK